MIEFLLEHEGKTYRGIYCVDDELAITVRIDGKECRTPSLQMRPAAEAITIARKMLDEAAGASAEGVHEPSPTLTPTGTSQMSARFA